jgi:hypothetical protein
LANTSYVDGISDQHLYNWNAGALSVFSNAWVGNPPSHIKLVRYVVQWNVTSHGYEYQDAIFKSWYEEVTLELGPTIEVALADYSGANEPSSSEYRTELEKLLIAYPNIRYIEAWNEPNHHSTAVKFYVEPAAAAHYMNEAYSVCQTHNCTAVAGDFLDESNMSEYEAKYIAGSNLNPKDPPNWGMHPYDAVDTRETGPVEAFRNGLPGKGTERIWFTEIGAYYCKRGESTSGSENATREAYQAARASYLVNTLIPHTTNLEHVFYYEYAFEGLARVNCSNEEDTELYAPPSEGQSIQARSAASVIFGPEGPPSASTGTASGVTPTQATLNGSVNPQGIDTTKYYFQYGTTTAYTSSTFPGDAGQSLNWETKSATITGLQPSTTYHYRIVATNIAGTSYGNDSTFTTPSPPAVTTGSATSVQQFQATLKASVNPNGADTHYYFEYGTSTSYGSDAPAPPGGDAGSGSSAVEVSTTIANLLASTTYHYRIVASNWAGSSYGADHEFTTELTATPAPLFLPNGEQEIFYRGTNGQLYYWYWNNVQWALEWMSGAPAMAGNPTSLRTTEGNQEIFYRDTNGRLDYWWWNGTKWSLQWLGEAGAMGGEPAPLLLPNGEQEILYGGTNGLLYWWYWKSIEWSLQWLGSGGGL